MAADQTGASLDVDVIIVAHDAGDLLERAVASVEGQVAPGRVVVVDAESTDGSVDAVVAAHPTVRVVRVENRGFSASNNIGIAATDGEFVLLLNPDAELEDRCLRALVSRAHSNRTVAIVSPKIVDPDGSLQSGSFGQFPTFSRVSLAHLNALARKMSRGLIREGVQIHGTTPVDWVTGACMLVRRTAIKQAGPMDEGFFLYYEDVEWCHRMHDNGWNVLIEPTATCVHHRGASGGSSPAAVRAYRESFYRYCRLYNLKGLAAAARLGLAARRVPGEGA